MFTSIVIAAGVATGTTVLAQASVEASYVSKLFDAALSSGGIWAVMSVYLILYQQRRQKELESWVHTEVIKALNDSTIAMNKLGTLVEYNRSSIEVIKERQYANKE